MNRVWVLGRHFHIYAVTQNEEYATTWLSNKVLKEGWWVKSLLMTDGEEN
jgi:hypothetical protein